MSACQVYHLPLELFILGLKVEQPMKNEYFIWIEMVKEGNIFELLANFIHQPNSIA